MTISFVGLGTAVGEWDDSPAQPTDRTWTLTPQTHADTQVGDWLVIFEESNNPPPSEYFPPNYPQPARLTPPAGLASSASVYVAGSGSKVLYVVKATAAGAQSVGNWVLTLPANGVFAWAAVTVATVRGGRLDGAPAILNGRRSSLIPSGSGDFFVVLWGGVEGNPAPTVSSTTPPMDIDGTAWAGLNTPAAGNFGYYTFTSTTLSTAQPTGWYTAQYVGMPGTSIPLMAEMLFTEGSAPSAPTVLGPSGYVDRTQPVPVTWVFSDPDPGDYQTSADVQYRPAGSGSWTVVTGAATSGGSYLIPAGTLGDGVQYEAQVRCTDSTGRVGPWSPSTFFTARTPPAAVNITGPSGTVTSLTTSPLAWSGSGYAYIQARRCADTAGTVVYEDSGVQAAASTWTFGDATTHVDGGTEHWQVRVAQYPNLWSPWADTTLTFQPVHAPRPVVTTEPDPATGSITVRVVTPTPGAGQAATDHVNLTRTWSGDGKTVTVATGLPSNPVYIDYLAGPGDNDYIATAYTADGVPTTSTEG